MLIVNRNLNEPSHPAVVIVGLSTNGNVAMLPAQLHGKHVLLARIHGCHTCACTWISYVCMHRLLCTCMLCLFVQGCSPNAALLGEILRTCLQDSCRTASLLSLIYHPISVHSAWNTDVKCLSRSLCPETGCVVQWKPILERKKFLSFPFRWHRWHCIIRHFVWTLSAQQCPMHIQLHS